MNRVHVSLISYTDPVLGEVWGLDAQVEDVEATVADLLSALDAFAAERLADCRGCDGCCRERAPLIAADIPALAQLLPPDPFPVHQVLRQFARVSVDQEGAADIILSRLADQGCVLLQREGKYCTHWPQRPFVCRSHFCLPRSPRLERLREDIVNHGENELTRLILAEEAAGALPLSPRPMRDLVQPEDYPRTAISDILSYEGLPLRNCVSAKLWRQLYSPDE